MAWECALWLQKERQSHRSQRLSIAFSECDWNDERPTRRRSSVWWWAEWIGGNLRRMTHGKRDKTINVWSRKMRREAPLAFATLLAFLLFSFLLVCPVSSPLREPFSLVWTSAGTSFGISFREIKITNRVKTTTYIQTHTRASFSCSSGCGCGLDGRGDVPCRNDSERFSSRSWGSSKWKWVCVCVWCRWSIP